MNNSANAPLAVLVGVIAVGLAVIPTQIYWLDAATAAQCATHDWPAEKHAIHMDFCHTYGYITK